MSEDEEMVGHGYNDERVEYEEEEEEEYEEEEEEEEEKKEVDK